MKRSLTILSVTSFLLAGIFAISKMALSEAKTIEDPKVKIYEKKGFRFIESNGIPDHKTGRFPNRGNPNRISKQKYKFKIPLKPEFAGAGDAQDSDRTEDRRGGRRGPPPLFGVALNGVPFDPGTAEAWNNDRRSGWNNEALTGKINLGVDMNNAHVQPNGAYHYHGIPSGLVNKLIAENASAKMILIGYAADGFPIYSEYGYENPKDAASPMKKLVPGYRLKKGIRPNGPGGNYDGTYFQDFEYDEEIGDLDKCNGRFGITPEYPSGTYHYFLTDTFPFIPRCHQGSADKSFKKGPPPGGRFGRRPERGRRPPFSF